MMMWTALCCVSMLYTAGPVPYDPGVCAQCAIDELACEGDCADVKSAGLMACAMGHTPGTPGYWACKDAVEFEYDYCMVNCDAVGRACLGRNNCPEVADGD